MHPVKIWTDGGLYKSNPGPGGYAAIICIGDYQRELTGGFAMTTNNRMELYGPIMALEALKPGPSITVVSDSQYVVNGIMKQWAKKWRLRGWRPTAEQREKGWDRVPNWDLWDRLLNACHGHRVTFEWVRGHNGDVLNEACDRLAGEAASKSNLPIDVGYVPAKKAPIAALF